MPIIYKNLSCSDSYFSHKWPIIVVGKKGHHNRVKFFLCFSCTKKSNWNCSRLYLMTLKTINNTLSLGISDDDPQDTRVSRPNKEQCSFIWVFFFFLTFPAFLVTSMQWSMHSCQGSLMMIKRKYWYCQRPWPAKKKKENSLNWNYNI